MTINTPGWGEKRGLGLPRRDDRIDELAAVVLGSGPGADLLAALRRKYFEGAFNPDTAPEGALRTRLAKQQFVHELETARDRGRAALDAAAEAKKTT